MTKKGVGGFTMKKLVVYILIIVVLFTMVALITQVDSEFNTILQVF